jgi:hypothetical protein
VRKLIRGSTAKPGFFGDFLGRVRGMAKNISEHLAGRLRDRGIYVDRNNRTRYLTAPGKPRNTKKKSYPPALPDERLPESVVAAILRDPRELTHQSAWARAAGIAACTLSHEVFGPAMREGPRRALSRVICKVVRGEVWLLRSHKGREGGERFDFYPVEEARRLLAHQNAVQRSTLYGTIGFGFQA